MRWCTKRLCSVDVRPQPLSSFVYSFSLYIALSSTARFCLSLSTNLFEKNSNGWELVFFFPLLFSAGMIEKVIAFHFETLMKQHLAWAALIFIHIVIFHFVIVRFLSDSGRWAKHAPIILQVLQRSFRISLLSSLSLSLACSLSFTSAQRKKHGNEKQKTSKWKRKPFVSSWRNWNLGGQWERWKTWEGENYRAFFLAAFFWEEGAKYASAFFYWPDPLHFTFSKEGFALAPKVPEKPFEPALWLFEWGFFFPTSPHLFADNLHLLLHFNLSLFLFEPPFFSSPFLAFSNVPNLHF